MSFLLSVAWNIINHVLTIERDWRYCQGLNEDRQRDRQEVLRVIQIVSESIAKFPEKIIRQNQ